MNPSVIRHSSFFDTAARVELLQSVAASWLGTTFMPNAAIKAAGVCCQKLVGAIYTECGFLPAGFEVPSGPMNWSHANTRSLISDYMDQQPQFCAVERQTFDATEAQPGDMVGFKIGGCVQHCGIVTAADGTFIHCMRPGGVLFGLLREASNAQRLDRIWRPIIQ